MGANVSPSTTVPPTPSTGRSLLSRLTAPLKSRTRNLTDFHIRPDEPHRKYSPGDLVKGAVVLTVVKPIRLTHLTVCLHGFVRVYKNPNSANEPVPDLGLTASNNPRKSQYFGNGHASLFQDEQTLCGEGRLDTGVYEFNFELEFPRKGLPSSVDVSSCDHINGSFHLLTSVIVRERHHILPDYCHYYAPNFHHRYFELRPETVPRRICGHRTYAPPKSPEDIFGANIEESEEEEDREGEGDHVAGDGRHKHGSWE